MIRFFDIFFSFLGILLLSPVFFLLYKSICLESRGGGFYRQLRVGRYGKDFYVYKFRSMRVGADKQGLITVGGRDPRITRIGYFIRKYKLDELPQLFNVLKGDMSLVGPRPEVRKYVNLYTSEQLKVLQVRPGITDPPSIRYRNENELLAHVPDPEKYYREVIMPDKLKINLKYIANISFKNDLQIILHTFFAILK